MVNKFELLQQSLQTHLNVLKEMPILITHKLVNNFQGTKSPGELKFI